MDKETEDVRSFYKKFDIVTSDVPVMLTKRKLQERIECMQEELDEFKKAVAEQDFPEQADALIDLVYFAKGTAAMMGLPWAPLWNDVQRANIGKVRGVGKRGHVIDMVKPDGWIKPDGAAILALHGFKKEQYLGVDGQVDESLCVDDLPNYMLDDIADLISAANSAIRGENMTAPVELFSETGMRLSEFASHQPGIKIKTVTAQSIKIPVSSIESKNLDHFKFDYLTAAMFHMYLTTKTPEFNHVVGDEISAFDPVTFKQATVTVTQQMIDAHAPMVIVRLGVQQE